MPHLPSRRRVARPGDLVVVHQHYNTLKSHVLARDSLLNNRFGTFAHNAILDKPLGRRLYSQTSNTSGHSNPRFVHVLLPNPHLWSLCMLHRTQIVYPHDAALITFHLNLRPGSLLLESGTGSGAASVAFAHAVAPGRVISFEFHTLRAQAAKRDFAQLGLSHIISVVPGVDVVAQGFVDVPDTVADAVFLDLPVPYAVIQEVYRVLRPDASVCIFSPCIEQVQRTCAMLRSHGFHSVRTVTAPVKTFETREMKLETPAFDRLSHNNNPSQPLSPDAPAHPPPAKRPRVAIQPSGPVTEKLLRARNRTAGAERLAVASMNDEQSHVGRVIRPKIPLHSRPFPSMKGHTSYLTFATKSVWFERSAAAPPQPTSAGPSKECTIA